MAKTKLRRSLYVGLGGTGMNAILKTKKMFVENYGEVPPMISFLGIDTDGGAYTKTEKTKFGEIVSLIPSEQCSICVSTPGSYYLNNKESMSWMPLENVAMIKSLDKGAGQVRTNGRLAVIHNATKIANAFKTAIGNIRSDISDNEQYELLPNAMDEVHIIFSICGGTGCGTFIDFAYMLNHLYNNDKRTLNINGYAILPDVFTEMVKAGNAMARVKPNAYGAIQDLDYLMHLDPNSKDVSFNWISDRCTTNDKPFSAFYLIDNKNEDNICYKEVGNLTEMVSLALVSAAGQIGTDTASVADNVEKCMIEGSLNVGNKIAWVSSIGTSCVKFNGFELAELYKLYASQRIIQRLIMSCENGNLKADAWIDSPNVNIRETGSENDNVINFLHDSKPKYLKDDIADPKNPKAEVDEYLNDIEKETRETCESRASELKERVLKELDEKFFELLNQGDCGITLADDTLKAIFRQVDTFKNEMVQEKKDLKDREPSNMAELKAYIDDLKECMSTFLKRGKTDKISDLVESVNKIAIVKVNYIRRIYAEMFFTMLLENIQDKLEKVNIVKQYITSINEDIVNKISDVSVNTFNAKTVEIDLASELKNRVVVDDNDIIMSDFIKTLPGKSLCELQNKGMMFKYLMDYAQTLSPYKSWKKRTIDNVIDELEDDVFKNLMERLMAKAKPFLKLDSNGMITNLNKQPIDQAINRYYYVVVPNKSGSRLFKNDTFKNMNDASLDIKFIESGMQDRIIIYRQDGTFPACAVSGVTSWATEYERSAVNCHIDSNLKKRMDEEHYAIRPSKYTDDTLSFWVYGCIFGLIKFEKDTYWYRDKENGSSLNKYWVSTGERYRDLAYDKFVERGKSLLTQYESQIEQQFSNMGKEKWKEMVADIKENYLEKYSQCPISLEIKKRELEGTLKLMEQELDFVEKRIGI